MLRATLLLCLTGGVAIGQTPTHLLYHRLGPVKTGVFIADGDGGHFLRWAFGSESTPGLRGKQLLIFTPDRRSMKSQIAIRNSHGQASREDVLLLHSFRKRPCKLRGIFCSVQCGANCGTLQAFAGRPSRFSRFPECLPVGRRRNIHRHRASLYSASLPVVPHALRRA